MASEGILERLNRCNHVCSLRSRLNVIKQTSMMKIKDPVRRFGNLKHPLLTSDCKSSFNLNILVPSLFLEAKTCSSTYQLRPQIWCVTGKGCGMAWCTDLSSNLKRLET